MGQARRAFGCCLALAAATAPANAQEGTWSVDLGASHSRPPAGAIAEAASYLTGGMRLETFFGSSAFAYGATYGGLSLSPDGSNWLSALVGGGLLAPVSSEASLGLSLAGEAFTVGEPFPYRAVTLQAEPQVRWDAGVASLRLKGYGAIGASEVMVVDTLFRLTRFGLVRLEAGTEVRADQWAWGGRAELNLALGSVEPRVALEAYDTPQGGYLASRLGLLARFGEAEWSVELGMWGTPTGAELMLTSAVDVSLGSVIGAVFSGGRFGPDPLLDTPAAGGATAALAVRLLGFGEPDALATVVRSGARPVVRFELEEAAAQAVSVVGDFTEWRDVPMVLEDGVWRVELPVAPGAYAFGFRADGEWFVPAGAPGVSTDEWGRLQATLIVSDSQSSEPDVTSEGSGSSVE